MLQRNHLRTEDRSTGLLERDAIRNIEKLQQSQATRSLALAAKQNANCLDRLLDIKPLRHASLGDLVWQRPWRRRKFLHSQSLLYAGSYRLSTGKDRTSDTVSTYLVRGDGFSLAARSPFQFLATAPTRHFKQGEPVAG